MFNLLLLIVVGVAFTAFAALVFSSMTLGLGKLIPEFEVEGPEDWSFGDFYKRYLIVAAVYTVVTLTLGGSCLGLLLGLAALAVAYKFVFDAGWLQAVIIGSVGGFVAGTLFFILLAAIQLPLQLIS